MSEENVLEQQLEGQEGNSVYDFLYHDSRRIASFLSQFQTYGVLQSVKASESAGKLTTRKGIVEASGSLPFVGSGKVDLERDVTSDERDITEHTYDPLWRNACTFLDYIESASLLCKDAASARIGQFLIASGQLVVCDLSMFKKIWGLEATKRAMRSSFLGSDSNTSRAERRRHSKQDQESHTNAVNAAVDMFEYLPHTIQAAMHIGADQIWTILQEDSMVVRSADILLKHGVVLSGDWNMVGIMDAYPSSGDEDLVTKNGLLSSLNAMAPMMSQFIPSIKGLLGKPSGAFGVTPLLIFRRIG